MVRKSVGFRARTLARDFRCRFGTARVHHGRLDAGFLPVGARDPGRLASRSAALVPPAHAPVRSTADRARSLSKPRWYYSSVMTQHTILPKHLPWPWLQKTGTILQWLAPTKNFCISLTCLTALWVIAYCTSNQKNIP